MGKICDDLRPTKIYTLEFPKGNVRYVGKTVSSLRHRLGQHLTDVHRTRTHKSNWVRKLLKLGEIPIITLIDEVPWKDSVKCEIYWIQYFNEHFNITNHSTGGEGSAGVVRTKEQIQKHKEILREKVSKKVYQYNKQGVLLSSFRSPIDAAEVLNLRNENIAQCCNLGKKSHGGYIWSYLQLSPSEIVNKYSHTPVDYSKVDRSNNNFVAKRKKVEIMDIENNVVHTVNSVKEASDYTGVNKPSICRRCLGTQGKPKGKYDFSYGK